VVADQKIVTFIQVDDPFSNDGEHFVGKNDTDKTLEPQVQQGQQNAQLQVERDISPSPSIERHFSFEDTSSLLNHPTDLGATPNCSGKRPRGLQDGSLFHNSPGWHTPATDVTIGTPESVESRVLRSKRSGRNADPKVIVSHMLRHFKEGPGQW
jgi:hypothetical protein